MVAVGRIRPPFVEWRRWRTHALKISCGWDKRVASKTSRDFQNSLPMHRGWFRHATRAADSSESDMREGGGRVLEEWL